MIKYYSIFHISIDYKDERFESLILTSFLDKS